MMHRSEIDGYCDERFERIRDAFRDNFERFDDLGAAFALSLDGELVVDLWGGAANGGRSRAWTKDTIVPVSSSSKVVIALCGLMLVDRGLIEPDAPVADYWPEFAANGKAELPVRYIFSHSAGLPGLDGMPGFDVIGDFDEVTRRLAAQKPWWTPGEESGYHAFTFGHLIGELVRRTTGQTISDFFRTEVAGEPGIDFHFGLPAAEAGRMAEVVWAEEEPVEIPEKLKTSVFYRTLGYLENVEKIPFWELDIPAGNGVANARALVQVGSILARGGLAGDRRIVSEATAAFAGEEQIYGHDLVFWAPVRYGFGIGLTSREFPLPWKRGMHWGGRGGSSLIMAPEIGAAFAYTPNQFRSGRGVLDERGAALRDAVIDCLG